MNETTLLLAQIMGPALGIMGLGMLLNQRHYRKIYTTVGSEDFDMFLTPLIMLVAGTAMVMKHFLWGSFAEVLVSIAALGTLVKGAFLAVFPNAYKAYVRTVFKKNGMMIFAGLVWLVLGAYLSWVGFLA